MKNKPFQKIEDASRTTGLSRNFLRKGCKDGTIPCIKAGTKYMINVPAMLAQYGVNGEVAGND